MKAISLWEPWASLIRTGSKTYETRSWSTPYRGKLLICAAKGGFPKYELLELLSYPGFQKGLTPLLGPSKHGNSKVQLRVGPEHLNFGKAVALVELLDCLPTEILTWRVIGKDKLFGNFSHGRFAWKLKLLRSDFIPFPVRGSQRLFNVDDRYVNRRMAAGAAK